MISLYGLSYRNLNYAKRSVESIINNASEPISFTLCDNKSPMSPNIVDWSQSLIPNRMKRAVFFSENIRGRALLRAYEKWPPDGKDGFFVFTDLDVVVPDGLDWIAETRRMMSKNVASGYSLSLENYIPPNGGHSTDGDLMGFWLLALNQKIYEDHYPHGQNLQDLQVLDLFRTYGSIQRSAKCLYHLGWDAWRDDPEYFEIKKAGINWNNDVPAEMTVYE